MARKQQAEMPSWIEFLIGGGAVKVLDLLFGLAKSRSDSRRADKDQQITAARSESERKQAEERLHMEFDERVIQIQQKLFDDFDRRMEFLRSERDELATDLKSARAEIDQLRDERQKLHQETADLRTMVATLTKQIHDLTTELSVALAAAKKAEDAYHLLLEEQESK